jgi:hypothetical protein
VILASSYARISLRTWAVKMRVGRARVQHLQLAELDHTHLAAMYDLSAVSVLEGWTLSIQSNAVRRLGATRSSEPHVGESRHQAGPCFEQIGQHNQ